MNLGPKKFATRSTFSLSGSEDESDRGQVSTKRIIMLSSTTRTGQHEKKTAAAEQTVLGVVAAASGVGDCVSFRAGNWNRRPIVESESRSNIFSLFIFVWAREEMDGWLLLSSLRTKGCGWQKREARFHVRFGGFLRVRG